jgi:hypothetical protein
MTPIKPEFHHFSIQSRKGTWKAPEQVGGGSIVLSAQNTIIRCIILVLGSNFLVGFGQLVVVLFNVSSCISGDNEATSFKHLSPLIC